jgi:cell wall-associated NlpC family hydrolase
MKSNIALKTVAALTVSVGIGLAAPSVADASADASTSPPVSVVATQAEGQAVNFVDGRMGDTSYDGLCLQLLQDAYGSAGVDISATASDNSGAQQFWDTTSLEKHAPSDNIPAGALIFWGATSANPYGHVAIALGGDTAASSEERDNYGIHTFSINARNAAGYAELGYVIPA